MFICIKYHKLCKLENKNITINNRGNKSNRPKINELYKCENPLKSVSTVLKRSSRSIKMTIRDAIKLKRKALTSRIIQTCR